MDKAKILIVEDEVIIAMEIESNLTNFGYDVIATVSSGNEAVRKIEQCTPDLVLMDIRIQGEKDGIETAEIIRINYGIPVVFSTAYLDQERIERAKITMPFGYVLKPIQERDLKVTIEMALYVAKVDAERRNAELVSLENEKQYQDLFNSMLDAFALHEMLFDDAGNPIDYRFLKVNPAFEKLTGLRKDEIIGKTVLETMPNTERYWIEKYGNVVQTGEPMRFENFAQALDKYYEVNAYRPQTGQFACVFKDITTQKQVEKKLIASETKYRRLFEDSIDGYVLVDPETGTISDCNKALADFVGCSKEEIIGQHQRILHPPESLVEGFSKTFLSHSRNESSDILQDQLMTKDGHLKNVNIRARVFEAGNKKIMQGIFRLLED